MAWTNFFFISLTFHAHVSAWLINQCNLSYVTFGCMVFFSLWVHLPNMAVGNVVLCWKDLRRKVKKMWLIFKDIEDPLALWRAKTSEQIAFIYVLFPWMCGYFLCLNMCHEDISFLKPRFCEKGIFYYTHYSVIYLSSCKVCKSLTKKVLYAIFFDFCLNLWKRKKN